jgi:5-methylcytosine-specific restriction endonuclease McrA
MKAYIQAKSKGGKDHIDNYQTMCQPCNVRKGSTHESK